MDKLVPHPRFPGKSPADRTGVMVAHIFPQTALLADVSRQLYSIYPRPYYVDMLKTCDDCSRPFIFYAREQRYWYETLGYMQ